MPGIYDPTKFTFNTFLEDITNVPIKAMVHRLATTRKTLPKICTIENAENGSGKTHLLRAATTVAKHAYPDSAPLYMHADQYGNTVTYEKCAEATLLCIDDLHMMGSSTERQIAQLLEQRSNNGDTTILAMPQSSRKLIGGKYPTVASRLSWGPVLTLLAPSDKLKRAVATAVMQAADVKLTDQELTRFLSIANKMTLRDLIQDAMSFAIQAEASVEQALNMFVPRNISFNTVRSIPLELIATVAADIIGIPLSALLGQRRTKTVATARHFAIAACRQLTTYTLDEIGLMFGGRDHSSILHAHNKIKNLVRKNPADKELLDKIISTVLANTQQKETT